MTRIGYLDVARAYESAALRFTLLAAPASPDRELLLDIARRYRSVGRELRRADLDRQEDARCTVERVAA